MCHSHPTTTRTVERPAEDVFAQDPELRASDREREDTVTQLREHGTAGRLDVDELEERIGSAYAARTRGDLTALLRDLPGTLRPRPAPRPSATEAASARPRPRLAPFAQVSAILIVIWALTGAGLLAAWVMAGGASSW